MTTPRRRCGMALLLAALCLAPGVQACRSARSRPEAASARATPPSWQEASNASYDGIEAAPVALRAGCWEGPPFAPGGAARPTLELVRDFWLAGDLDGDGSEEAIVLLTASSGGSGSELHLAALARRGDAVVNRGTARVGDRVQVRAARVEAGRVALDVVQAGPSDALCCPGEKATRTWGREGEALVELDARITGRLTPGDLAGVEWVLTHLARDEAAPAEPEVTFVLEGERASGRGGCNRYFATVRAGDAPGELAFGPIGATRMACPAAEQQLESRYLAALAHSVRFAFAAGRLALSYEQDGRLGTLLFRGREPARTER